MHAASSRFQLCWKLQNGKDQRNALSVDPGTNFVSGATLTKTVESRQAAKTTAGHGMLGRWQKSCTWGWVSDRRDLEQGCSLSLLSHAAMISTTCTVHAARLPSAWRLHSISSRWQSCDHTFCKLFSTTHESSKCTCPSKRLEWLRSPLHHPPYATSTTGPRWTSGSSSYHPASLVRSLLPIYYLSPSLFEVFLSRSFLSMSLYIHMQLTPPRSSSHYTFSRGLTHLL